MINAKRAPRGGIRRRLQKTKRAVFRPCDTWRRCTFAKGKLRCWQIFSRNICPAANSSRGIFAFPFSLVSLAEEGRISPSSSPLSSFPPRLRRGKRKGVSRINHFGFSPPPLLLRRRHYLFFAASPHFPSVRRPVCTIHVRHIKARAQKSAISGSDARREKQLAEKKRDLRAEIISKKNCEKFHTLVYWHQFV